MVQRLKYLAQMIMGTYKPPHEDAMRHQLNEALIKQSNACSRLNKAIADLQEENRCTLRIIDFHK
jgi:hypothetical protein